MLNHLIPIIMKNDKILIVDDDIDVVNMYKAILEKEGYRVIYALNKKSGMELAKAENPRVIVLDVVMTTHYEGFEMKLELEKDPDLKKIPVLIQTSVEVLTTTDGQKESIQEMAWEFRKDARFRDLQVLLIRNKTNGLNGIDYINEKGINKYLEVDGFLSKPVKAAELLPEVRRLLGKAR